MNKKTAPIILMFLFNIPFWAVIIYCEAVLASGGKLIPDPQRGISFNLNLVELILAIVMIVIQLFLTVVIWRRLNR